MKSVSYVATSQVNMIFSYAAVINIKVARSDALIHSLLCTLKIPVSGRLSTSSWPFIQRKPRASHGNTTGKHCQPHIWQNRSHFCWAGHQEGGCSRSGFSSSWQRCAAPPWYKQCARLVMLREMILRQSFICSVP